jgi:hypothetical protein
MDVMARRGVNPAALVLNETADSAASIAETVVSLQHFCDPVPILSIAREGTGNPADINAASFGKIADLVLTA